MILIDGLEEIGEFIFVRCKSLHEIVIPSAVKIIKKLGAFTSCSGLTTVTLGEGLEEIEVRVFENCLLLEQIVIPSAVKAIERGNVLLEVDDHYSR